MARKKKSCISTVLLSPFYLVYLGFLLVWSFVVGIVKFFYGLLSLPFKSKTPTTGIEYEAQVANYLRKKGYRGVEVTKATGDYGVDITAYKNGKKYAVQCKRYSQPVGISAVQEVVAGKVHYNCEKAMVVTNNVFTAAAQKLAAENDVILLSEIGG